jgi:hypothetical protein
MSYTVGVKRRFLPGYRPYFVTGHSWSPRSVTLNLLDGSQEHIETHGLKVYPDFWTHLAQVQAAQVHVPRETFVVPPIVTRRDPEPIDEPSDYAEPAADSPDMQEVKRRAAERVRSILSADGAH